MQVELSLRKCWIFIILTSVICSCAAQPFEQIYIDKNKPRMTPAVFAPGFISTEQSEYGSVFSLDGKEFFYAVDMGNTAEIRYTKFENNSWTKPVAIISDDSYSHNDPFLSPDEKKLYYISDRPRDATDTIGDYDIWYSNLESGKWSAPINAGDKINSNKNEYYISFTDDGTMYFSSNKAAAENMSNNFDIYSSKIIDGVFQEAKLLDDSINSGSYEADVFIAPDESYIIFCARREDGYGRGDLYISFKKDNGTWTASKNMGPIINSENHELCPFVTLDGKFLFYTSDQDIYWVSTDILAAIKNGNE